MSIPPTDSHTPLRPSEQLPIALFGGEVLSVRGPDGTIYLGIHDEQLSPGMRQFRVRTPRGPSDQDFLELERIPLWFTPGAMPAQPATSASRPARPSMPAGRW
jgi:hypothetical protein